MSKQHDPAAPGSPPNHPLSQLNRRQFVSGVAAAALLSACGGNGGPGSGSSSSGASSSGSSSGSSSSGSSSGSSSSGSSSGGTAALPDPSKSGIEHIIVVMMENRSFDHYLGWLPGADGIQAGLSYADQTGKLTGTYPLAPEFQGCGKQDPDHSVAGGMTQFNGGACDGFLKTSPDTFPAGYYTQQDLGFHGQAAPAWTAYDRYFCSILAETYPNRFYMHSAQTPVLHNGDATSTAGMQAVAVMPTIWDRLQAAGLSGTYYFSDAPFIGLYGSKYLNIAKPYAAFLADCKTGSLPSVSFIDPAFEDEGSGISRDDHPFSDIRNGQAFLDQIYQAVTGSPRWSKTALFITYDEWGGFFDHVPPPEAGVIPDADKAAFEGNKLTPSSRLGFRVPTLAISPYARRGHVAHGEYDHTSILKMIEWRWNLQPLTARDAQANNIAESFDFSAPNLDAPAFNVPTGPFGQPCTASSLPAGSAAAEIRARHFQEVRELRRLALRRGYGKHLA